jgi:hypothetical protein
MIARNAPRLGFVRSRIFKRAPLVNQFFPKATVPMGPFENESPLDLLIRELSCNDWIEEDILKKFGTFLKGFCIVLHYDSWT